MKKSKTKLFGLAVEQMFVSGVGLIAVMAHALLACILGGFPLLA